MNTWDRDKATEVVLFLANKLEPKRRRWARICRILYQADRLHLSWYGRLICHDDYAACHNGMRPMQTCRLMFENSSEAFYFTGTKIITRREYDTMKLSRSDKECLSIALTLYGRKKRRRQDSTVMDKLWCVATNRGEKLRGHDVLLDIPVSLLTFASSLNNAEEVGAYLTEQHGLE